MHACCYVSIPHSPCPVFVLFIKFFFLLFFEYSYENLSSFPPPQVFQAAEVPIEWEEHYVGDQIDPRTQSFLTWESLESVRRNKVGLKGPMATPIGKGHRSLNLTLRKELNLYANVRPCYSLPGYKTRYDNVNLITIRENTEGEYSGLEHQVSFFQELLMCTNKSTGCIKLIRSFYLIVVGG